ncbi:hypothetical protein T552_00638 [Pneumocystis carinii B80]|uniref:Protein kinase domain-containing protein n=1 Tax=Pneumocystis carinii (strain B80) TaxID=1408658 RepID=A0A0W4ZP84_PNEC8|nr:hypothetical protein T552_00638 [Pneumocystis carinii B80]KTW30159.1 hypothetical protein T552_00638 [Pneumocystis carinii B80]
MQLQKTINIIIKYTYFYIRQLRPKAVAHRDIKPKNILHDRNKNLKILNFGFISLFKYNNQTRKLSSECGSLSYIAPGILLLNEKILVNCKSLKNMT